VCPRVGAAARVTEVEAARLEHDAACDVWVVPTSGPCKVRIKCGELTLYDGYARAAADGTVVDDQPSGSDRDPRVFVDVRGGRAEVSDDGVTHWSVKLDLLSATH
jgi:hypothetical protein